MIRLEDPGNWGYSGKKMKLPKSGGCLFVILAMAAGAWATISVIAEGVVL